MTYRETLYPMPGDPANKANQELVAPKPKYFQGTKPTAAKASMLVRWFYREDVKRKDGQLNEIDIAEITQALRGTINKWSKPIRKERQPFQELIELVNGRNSDKQKLIALWNEIKTTYTD